MSCRVGGNSAEVDEYDNGDAAAAEAERRLKQRLEPENKEKQDSTKKLTLANRPKQAPSGLLNDFILESLAYKNMHDREGEVTEAYGSTFDWVFAEAPKAGSGNVKLTIKEWLSTQDGGPIYWITGKPGSGKSTFIRYLYQHPLTAQCVQEWAGEKQVVTAGFFFWTSGSREQRSQTGLLRSLLHQLLDESPELISTTFPDLWSRLLNMTTKDRIKLSLEWTVEELLEAFLLLIKHASETMKICLFIDGMDEFEGDQQKLIDVFKGLSSGEAAGNVKMCLSSRPWAVFQEAFEHSVPNLRLQDLTYHDMYRYVSENLTSDDAMRDLLMNDVSASKRLVRDTIDKADGVFLWVRLAIDKILGRFKAEEELAGVERTLDSMPGDLDNLFAKLLFEDPSSNEIADTATIYSLMRARELVADVVRNDSANNLTVWDLAFALWKDDDKLMSPTVGVEQPTETFIAGRCAATLSYVKERFCGLLDFHARRRQGPLRVSKVATAPYNDADVEEGRKHVVYIHRTVRDWLVSGAGIHEKLLSKLPRGFDPHLRLLRSYILQMKRPIDEIEHHRVLDDWWPDISVALTHARHITNDPENLQRPFVNELDSVISWWWLKKPDDPYDHWARNAFGSFFFRMKAPPIWQPFLGLAVRFGLRTYVREEVAARNEEDKKGVSAEQEALQPSDTTPLLVYATEYLCSRNKAIFPLSDPGLVEDLLWSMSRINPGVNHEYKDFTTRATMTPWIALLRHLRDARRRRWIKLYDMDDDGTKRWTRIVKLFLEVGGADADALVVADTWDPEITAHGVLELLDNTYGDVEIREAKSLLESVQAT